MKSFVALKDSEVNFQNNLKCKLINPAEPKNAIIIKHHLKFIKKKIREKQL